MGGAGLAAHLGQLSARTAFHEERDEVADWSSIEACVAVVDDVCHLLTGDTWVVLSKLERLRRWHRDLTARDVFGAPSAGEADQQLKHCAERLADFTERVFAALHQM